MTDCDAIVVSMSNFLVYVTTNNPSSAPTSFPTTDTDTDTGMVPPFFVGRDNIGVDTASFDFGGLNEGQSYALSLTVETYDDSKLGIGTDLWDIGLDMYSIEVTVHYNYDDNDAEESDSEHDLTILLATDASHHGPLNYNLLLQPTRDATITIEFIVETTVSAESIRVSSLDIPGTYRISLDDENENDDDDGNSSITGRLE